MKMRSHPPASSSSSLSSTGTWTDDEFKPEDDDSGCTWRQFDRCERCLIAAMVACLGNVALGGSAGVLGNVALGGSVCFLFLTPVLGSYMDCKHQMARLRETRQTTSVSPSASDLV